MVGVFLYIQNEVNSMIMTDEISVYCAHDELVDISILVPNPHPQKQIELLAKIIRNQGWRTPITVSNRSGFVVRGHGGIRHLKFGKTATGKA
jgi:hypothetical protein